MIYDTDEYGNWLCPLSDALIEWDDEGEHSRRDTHPCRTPLHLVVEGTIPISSGLTLFTFSSDDFNSSSWRVECENRHVLLVSAGEESAEPFFAEYLLVQEQVLPRDIVNG